MSIRSKRVEPALSDWTEKKVECRQQYDSSSCGLFVMMVG